MYDISVNLTKVNLPEITSACFTWCQEQASIHQSNIDISNLGAVAVAMTALVLRGLILQWPDEISEHLNISETKLIYISHLLVHFAFILLALFLGYYAWIH